MKKSVKKLLSGLTITIITLAIGFAITAISFNLFDILNRNQMRALFALDVIILLAVGSIFWFIGEGKRAKALRQRELEKRHYERVKEREAQMSGVLDIINSANFAA